MLTSRSPRSHRACSLTTVTLVSTLLIIVLFISEITLYLNISTNTELVVDVTRDQKMRINFNITFPRLSCHGTTRAPTLWCASLTG